MSRPRLLIEALYSFGGDRELDPRARSETRYRSPAGGRIELLDALSSAFEASWDFLLT